MSKDRRETKRVRGEGKCKGFRRESEEAEKSKGKKERKKRERERKERANGRKKGLYRRKLGW